MANKKTAITKPKDKAKVGRPTIYSEKLAKQIFELLAMGKTMTKICQIDEMPSETTVYRWESENEEFRDKLKRAFKSQARTWASSIVDIADEEPRKNPVTKAYDPAAVTHQLNRIKVRQWLISKRLPEDFGEKVAVDNSGTLEHKISAVQIYLPANGREDNDQTEENDDN